MAPCIEKSCYVSNLIWDCFFLHFYHTLSISFTGEDMLKKLFKKLKLESTFLTDISIKYVDNELVITNYGILLDISKDMILFSRINVFGEALRVSYLSQYVVVIKGQIKKVERVEDENGL